MFPQYVPPGQTLDITVSSIGNAKSLRGGTLLVNLRVQNPNGFALNAERLRYDLELRDPDVNLGAGSGSHARQTAAVMCAFEPVVLRWKPDVVVVVGDGGGVGSGDSSSMVGTSFG